MGWFDGLIKNDPVDKPAKVDLSFFLTGGGVVDGETAKENENNHIPFGNMPQDMQQSLTQDYYKNEYRTAFAIAVNNVEHRNRVAEINIKAAAKENEKDRDDERQMDRDSEVLRCYYDEEHCISCIFERPSRTGKPFRVIDCRGLRLVRFISLNPSGEEEEAYKLAWDACPEGVCVDDKDLKEGRFTKTLQTMGIAMNTTRRNHCAVVGKVLAHLFANCNSMELPYGIGWRKDFDGNWRFIERDKFTFMEVKRSVRRDDSFVSITYNKLADYLEDGLQDNAASLDQCK